MDNRLSLAWRRRGIVILYIASVVLFCVFLAGEYGYWNPVLIAGALLSLAVMWFAFYISIVKPGIWKMARSKSDQLDEREKGVVLDSIRSSYILFGVVSLVLLFGTVLSVRYNVLVLTHRGHFSLGLAIVMALDFLISVLPPSFVAWREKVVED